MSDKNGKLPHWDMTAVYPGLDSPEFEASFAEIAQGVSELVSFFDEKGINEIDDVPDDVVDVLEMAIIRLNATVESITTLNAYLMSFLSTDATNELAQSFFSQMQPRMAQLTVLSTRFVAWVGCLDVASLINQSAVAEAHAFVLNRAKMEADYQMSLEEEALASALSLSGIRSWRKLFGDYVSQLMVEIEVDGELQSLPLTAVQNMKYDKDRAVRERAYEAANKTLASATIPMAAAMNSIKGTELTFLEKRGWESPLAVSLHTNVMDKQSYEAMMTAVYEMLPDMQNYLKAKARALNLPILRWYDRFVPLGESSLSWSYDEAKQFVVEQFGTYSEKMSSLAKRAFVENWIDAEPRKGKRGGAFCMWLQNGESRIMANFQPSFTAVGTLAHELGHAYHNLCLTERTALQRQLPMTLAETASTFCQKIVEEAALSSMSEQDKLVILDGRLEYASRVLVGATADVRFETELFEKRKQRALLSDELCELMIECQKFSLGDSVDHDYLNPYRWVYVPHYYSRSYYNYPYIFGLLFGLGLYANYLKNPDQFKLGYDDLLSSTGMSEATDLADRFGIDLHDSAFWTSSLDMLRGDITHFEKLVN